MGPCWVQKSRWLTRNLFTNQWREPCLIPWSEAFIYCVKLVAHSVASCLFLSLKLSANSSIQWFSMSPDPKFVLEPYLGLSQTYRIRNSGSGNPVGTTGLDTHGKVWSLCLTPLKQMCLFLGLAQGTGVERSQLLLVSADSESRLPPLAPPLGSW